MRIIFAAAAAGLALAACTPAEKAETKDDAADAGSAIKEEAQQVGSAIAAGASEAAQEVDEATDKLADSARRYPVDLARGSAAKARRR